MEKVIKVEDVTAALLKVTGAVPDTYTYEQIKDEDGMKQCAYVANDGQPSCIVGHLIHELAPEKLAEIGKWEREQWEKGDDTDVSCLMYEFGIFPTELENALEWAQRSQDMGRSWYAAKEAYLERV